MLSEIFRRLWPFNAPNDYVYVGFGAISFMDFIVFHKVMGVKEMISIERETESIDRVTANRPFEITVDNRNSSQVLPDLKYEQPHIIWLDYDDPLSVPMLLDSAAVASRANSGSVLAISFQCQKAKELNESAADEGDPLNLFKDRFGRERVSDLVEEQDLHGWPFGKLGRQMLLREIDEAVAKRNVEADDADKVKFLKICEIEYQDGAKMTTIVGMFISDGDQGKFDSCKFVDIDFMPDDQSPIRIVVPKLTVREIRKLEQQLPIGVGSVLDIGSIPKSEAEAFAELYRYLPNFAVLES
ncbi:MAG: hypothetical protein Q7T81_13835 [Pseudolabrys sp.]|nr:hypothetical protein [Pseudolabrys sp.]